MRPGNHVGLTMLVFAAALLSAVLLGEVVLRMIYASQGDEYRIWPPKLTRILRPLPEIMLGVSGESRVQMNSEGIRGDELTEDQTLRVLAIGGSTTACTYLDQSETWTQLVQQHLNDSLFNHRVWVGNAGMSGKTSRHHLIAMKYLPTDKLRIGVAIFLLGINDLTIRLSRDTTYDPHYFQRPDAEEELINGTFRGRRQRYPNAPFYKKLALWHLLRTLKPIFWPNHVEDATGRVYVKWREHRQQAQQIVDSLPDMLPALDEYARNIDSIIALATAKSIIPVFITQPSLWHDNMPSQLDSLLWLGGIGDFQSKPGGPYYSVSALEVGMQAYNETLMSVCKERGVLCLDLSTLLPKDTTVFFDDVHFNEHGARQVANHVTEFLLRHSGPLGLVR